MNSDVLNMNAVAATEIIAAHSRAVIFPAFDATPLHPFFSTQANGRVRESPSAFHRANRCLAFCFLKEWIIEQAAEGNNPPAAFLQKVYTCNVEVSNSHGRSRVVDGNRPEARANRYAPSTSPQTFALSAASLQ